MPREGARVDHAEAFVLHAIPFRETSLLVDVLTAEHGRLSLAARGARRPSSALRGVLLPFQRVSVSWYGRGEVRTLHAAEWQGLLPGMTGRALVCGFYLNELVVRLLPRDDPHPLLFAAYADALQALPGADPVDPVLRGFELAALAELGYGIDLVHEAGGQTPVQPGRGYRYVVEHGLVSMPAGDPATQISGDSLLAMQRADYSDATTRREARALLRSVLRHYLGDRPLLSRDLLAPFGS